MLRNYPRAVLAVLLLINIIAYIDRSMLLAFSPQITQVGLQCLLCTLLRLVMIIARREVADAPSSSCLTQAFSLFKISLSKAT